MTLIKGVFIIPLHIYPSKIFVLSDLPDEEVKLFLESRKVPDHEIEDFVYREYDDEPGLSFFYDGNVYIRLKPYEDRDDTDMRGTITHESFHAMNFVMRFIAASEPCQENEEPCAYLLEYIFDEICKKVGL